MNIFSSSHQTRYARRGSTADRRRSRTVTEAEDGTEGRLTQALTAALFSLPVMAVLGLVLLLIVTAVAYASPDPDSLTTPLSMGALGLTALLGGLVAARRGGSRPLVCGLLSGLLFNVLLLALSLFFGEDARQSLTLGLSSPLLWGLHGAVVLIAALGGKIGGRRPQKSKHGQHRR
ncbi:MAG: TIGR04086 family membrane protein [Clostridia bacterium]|nr:TIGR04086 family membrane protein [Clostridia bacterium]